MPSKVLRLILLSIIGLVLLGALCIYFTKQNTPLAPKVAITLTNQPSLGQKNAPLTIVAFEDLKCANCMRYNVQIFPSIQKNYIDTGKANYHLVTLAFIPGSLPAAKAALCANEQGQAHFFQYVDYIYHHQPDENEDWATIPNLLNFAQKVSGLDTQKLATCLMQNNHANEINHNFDLAQKIMGQDVVTPSVYINGVLVKPLTLQQVNAVAKAVR